MEVALERLRSEKGEVALRMGLTTFFGLLLLLVAIQVTHCVTSVQYVRNRANEAVLAAAAQNVSGIYGGNRESAGVSRLHADRWNTPILTADVSQRLQGDLGATLESDGSLSRPGAFRIRGLRTDYVNTEGQHLNFVTQFALELRSVLAADLLPPFQISVKVRTKYEPKF